MSSTNVTRGTGTPPAHVVADPLRVPAIAADLLPVEIRDARSNKRSRRRVVVGLVATALLVGAGYAGLFALSAAAEMQQESVEAEVATVQQQQNQFRDLVDAQTRTAAIDQQLASLMADDVRWQKVVRSIQQAAPSGVRVSSISANLSGFGVVAGGGAAGTAGGGQGGVKVPGGGAERVLGTITISGTTPRRDAMSRFLTDLEKAEGLDRPLIDSLSETTESGSSYSYSAHFDLTAAALGGRFAKGGK
ncbi:hypothetical protein GCM10010123_02630 [Pilimelia anulata]|uniref:Uncharacterized protein n=1 Tax=Pilimelia anulata TaxID=53371 RepID=A0A8J3F778_9ACTN|nr:hypothetical protein [Pilimelia anulata]GGJ76118.1 hypothetical protein GCM10010123_02630 [Pilimelia anulata]